MSSTVTLHIKGARSLPSRKWEGTQVVSLKIWTSHNDRDVKKFEISRNKEREISCNFSVEFDITENIDKHHIYFEVLSDDGKLERLVSKIRVPAWEVPTKLKELWIELIGQDGNNYF